MTVFAEFLERTSRKVNYEISISMDIKRQDYCERKILRRACPGHTEHCGRQTYTKTPARAGNHIGSHFDVVEL